MTYTGENYQLFTGDAMTLLNQLDLSAVDCVITDPPYGISGSSGTINKARAKGAYNADFEDTPEYIQSAIIPVISECIQRFKAVILTPGIRCLPYYPAGYSFGCFYQRGASGIQAFGNVDSQPILYYGTNPTGRNMGKKLSFPLDFIAKDSRNPHPCPKPPEAWLKLILEHTLPGQTILDPFCGSGTTGLCIQYGRKFIGFDLSAEYLEYSHKRLRDIKEQFYLLPN